MTQKRLLLGDEAIALGALHAGLSGVYAYPGTPSTEITEFIQGDALARERGVRSRWCTNEKTAMEAALGMSYAGKRALVCMKHVGMNVCADAFVNAGITGVKGGLVVDRINNLDTLEVQVELRQEYFTATFDTPAAIDELKKRLRDKLRSVLSINAQVQLKAPNAIERSQGKSVRVIDKRKLQ